MLDWCYAHGHISDNVAGEAINAALPPQPKAQRKHHRALPYNEVADALNVIESSTGFASKLALRLVVLTATRSGEVRGARWDEVDMDAREWLIPAERMKASAEHRIPLSDAALDVLEQAKVLDDGSGLIFPSATKQGASLSDMTLLKVLRDKGLAERTTVHGFRSSFRTWCEERTNADFAVKEMCLAHTVGSEVERSYSRSDLFDQRRVLMERWAAYVTEQSAEVVTLHAHDKL